MKSAGYCPETDSVFICPKGTYGDTIVVDGLRITLPRPPAEKTISRRSTIKRNQYFEREKKIKGLNRKNADVYEDYIKNQHRHLREGYWFMNNGEPTYLTGAHWLLLQWCKTEAGYFHFREAHQDLLYFFEAVWYDERSLGVIMGKSRRSGITHVTLAFLLAKSLTTEYKEIGGLKNFFGMTSMTNSYAKTNFDRFSMMFKGLPFYLKPVATITGSKIMYAPPEERDTKNNQEKEDYSNDFLNNEISYKATKNNSYDSLALKMYFGDEWSKWDNPNNIIKHFDLVKSTLTKGIVVFGKIYIVSTVRGYTGADPNTKDAQNGDRYKLIYDESRLSTRDRFGSTKSGLYKIFIPASDNYEGCIDIYGKPVYKTPDFPLLGEGGKAVTVGSKDDIRLKRKKYRENIQRSNEYYREYPEEESDMFRIQDADNTLNAEKLNEAIDHLDIIEPDLINSKRIRRFNLDWHEKKMDTFVVKKYNPQGRFTEYYPFPKVLENHVATNNLGFKKPLNYDLGCIGVDPYKVSETVDHRGSHGAAHLFTINNTYGIPANILLVDYCHKPSNVDIFMEDMLMMAHYYGVYALIESNVTELLRYMRGRKYRAFSMNRPDKQKKDLTKHELELGGIPTTSLAVKQLKLFALEKYIDLYIGEDVLEDKEGGDEANVMQGEKSGIYKEYMLSKRTLQDWLQLNPSNWTPRDLSVSSALSLIGCNSLNTLKEKEKYKKNNKNKVGDKYFKFYSMDKGNSVTHKIL